MQWDNSTNAGFSLGKPWLKVNPNYVTVNVANQETDPNSILNYFRKMVQLRKVEPALIYGDWKLVDVDNPSVFAYTRELNGKKLLVMLNFKAVTATVDTKGLDLSKAKVLISNQTTPSPKESSQTVSSAQGISLKPYEAMILAL